VLGAALDRIEDFDWVIFTSANGVRATMDRILESGKDARALANSEICAIGPATEQALLAYGLRADLKPTRFISTEIVRALEARDMSNARVALFRSDIAPMDIVTGLQELGASVESFVAYRTVPAEDRAQDLRKLLDDGDLDVLTFTSSSTVTNFMRAVGDKRAGLARTIPAVCIGPTTADAARADGLNVVSVAREYTVPGLVAALIEWSAARVSGKDQS
jgi:uroporphyrinogen III methyltransferase/synthase